jgi:type 1 fimbria pilin
MRRMVLVSILALAILVAFIPSSNAETAKEGTASGTMSFSGTIKALPMG